MNIKNILIGFFILILTCAFVGCDLDISNPNSPAEDNLNSYAALKLLATGMQGRIASSVGLFTVTTGLVSGEIGCYIAYMNYQSLRKFPDPISMQPLDPENTIVNAHWNEQFQIVKTANDLLKNVKSVSIAEGTESGIIALAHLGKAIAFWRLLMSFEQIPVETADTQTPVFVERSAAIDEALTLLAEAKATIAATPVSAEFTDDFLTTGMDLSNSISAMQARFALMKGDYTTAVQAANSVTNESYCVYNEASGINPLYDTFTKLQLHGAVSYWRDDAEAGDARVDAFFGTEKTVQYGQDTVYQNIIYMNPDDPYKLYTINEMHLIKAEAYARGGGGDAVAEINIIRNAAGLPNYSGTEILKQIYIQRSYELYITGNHYEDLRRFKDDGIDVVERHRNEQLAHEYVIYPNGELDSNPNTPDWP